MWGLCFCGTTPDRREGTRSLGYDVCNLLLLLSNRNPYPITHNPKHMQRPFALSVDVRGSVLVNYWHERISYTSLVIRSLFCWWLRVDKTLPRHRGRAGLSTPILSSRAVFFNFRSGRAQYDK